jgi:hypothetical protein
MLYETTADASSDILQFGTTQKISVRAEDGTKVDLK